MKLSEAIKILKRLIKEYGDMELKVWGKGEYSDPTLHIGSDLDGNHCIIIMKKHT